MNTKLTMGWFFYALILITPFLSACRMEAHQYTNLSDLEGGKTFAVPTGTVADQFVLDRYPDAKLLYYNTVPDCALAVKNGMADAAIYDLPVLKNIAAKNEGIVVLEGFLAPDNFGFAVHLDNIVLKRAIDEVVSEAKADGTYREMLDRWFPDQGEPGPMPPIESTGEAGVLSFGTAAVTEPMAYYNEDRHITGFDIELASRVAKKLNKRLDVIDLEFGALLPALISGRVEMIGAGMSITEERAKSVLFSDSYYEGGIAALVRAEDLLTGTPGLMHDMPAPFFEKVADSFYNNIIREERYRLILSGLYITILITIFAALFGTVLGGIICFMRMSKTRLVNRSASLFISLIRGTPVLVLLMIIYYVIFASWRISPVLVAVIAFGINFAAYVSEMFRSSILGVDNGQKEAGIASGFTKIQTFIHIIMPQALQRVLPVYKGEFISLLKMTSIVGYIAVQDLTKASDIIRSRTFDAFFPLIMAAVIYICLAWLLTIVLDRIEIGVDPKKRRTKKMKEVRL